VVEPAKTILPQVCHSADSADCVGEFMEKEEERAIIFKILTYAISTVSTFRRKVVGRATRFNPRWNSADAPSGSADALRTAYPTTSERINRWPKGNG
jgi:hypothetical protein